MFHLALFLAVTAGALARPLSVPQYKSYAGFQVVKCNVDTPEKQSLVAGLQENFEMDVWKEYVNGQQDIRVNAAQLEMLTVAGIECEIKIEDLGKVIAEQYERTQSGKASDPSVQYFTEYHSYDEQVAFYNTGCTSAVGCTRQVIGQSTQGRNQYEYRVFQNASNPVFFLDAGIHAREWISSATLQYIFNELTTTTEGANLRSRYNWIFHGHQNPDGYEYSRSNDRLWRKSRNVNQGSACIGTDLNRNWPTNSWGGGGSSPNPCSDTYHGSDAGSEVEVRNLIPRFQSAYNTYRVPAAISFHSYSQLILRPWGNTTANSPDETAMRNLGAAMAQAIEDTHGLTYDNIKSIELYVTTGTTSDWYYENSRSTQWGAHSYGYTYELRDTGRYGFLLPEEQIIPQGEEIWNAMVAMADFFD